MPIYEKVQTSEECRLKNTTLSTTYVLHCCNKLSLPQHTAIFTLHFLASPLIPMLSLCFPAAGVDPTHHSLAGEPDPREDHGGDATEAGGLQGLPTTAQAPEGAGEVSAGN